MSTAEKGGAYFREDTVITVGGIKTVRFLPFHLKESRYHFHTLENIERRSMKCKLNGNGMASARYLVWVASYSTMR